MSIKSAYYKKDRWIVAWLSDDDLHKSITRLVSGNDIAILRWFLDFNIDKADAVFEWACECGNIEIAEMTRFEYGQTTIQIYDHVQRSIRRGHMAFIERIFRGNINIRWVTACFIIACVNGRIEIARWLLEMYSDLETNVDVHDICHRVFSGSLQYSTDYVRDIPTPQAESRPGFIECVLLAFQCKSRIYNYKKILVANDKAWIVTACLRAGSAYDRFIRIPQETFREIQNDIVVMQMTLYRLAPERGLWRNIATYLYSREFLSLKAQSSGVENATMLGGSLIPPPVSAPASYTLTLPQQQGAAGQTLVNYGHGNLAWSSNPARITNGTNMHQPFSDRDSTW